MKPITTMKNVYGAIPELGERGVRDGNKVRRKVRRYGKKR